MSIYGSIIKNYCSSVIYKLTKYPFSLPKLQNSWIFANIEAYKKFQIVKFCRLIVKQTRAKLLIFRLYNFFMKKGQISNLLRKLGLLYFTDWTRYYIQKFNNRKLNRNFKISNPGVKLPPDYLIYESFQINYQKYYTDSIETSKWLSNHFRKHIDLRAKRILDWGCGPGRIIRHLPEVIGNDCKYYGTDYNGKSIEWCTKNLTGIEFNTNSLDAVLPYPDDFFDVIYGISIFTHLSEQLHYDWYKELNRILKPNGIMFFTTQGDNYKIKLTQKELDKYDVGQLIVRGKVKEGHRTFSAFHPKGFMTNLFNKADILEHIVTKPDKGKWIPQDIWIIKKT
jgi:SAM-dependent methyltransferase